MKETFKPPTESKERNEQREKDIAEARKLTSAEEPVFYFYRLRNRVVERIPGARVAYARSRQENLEGNDLSADLGHEVVFEYRQEGKPSEWVRVFENTEWNTVKVHRLGGPDEWGEEALIKNIDEDWDVEEPGKPKKDFAHKVAQITAALE